MAKTIELRIHGIVVVELTGKLEGARAAAAEERLYAESAGARQLVVDLSGVSFVNGAGLRVLLAAGHRQQSVGGNMCLCAVPSYIKEVLDVAGLTSVYRVHTTRAAAIAAAQAGG